MPPGPVRSVKLPSRHRRSWAASTGTGRNGSVAYQENIQMLTYNMALAQPGATVPLLPTTLPLSAVPLSQRLSSFALSAATDEQGRSVQQGARRWVRDSDELCVASIRRSNNINRINTYVATYKFHDPQWKPFLLPEVHVLPTAEAAGNTTRRDEPLSSSSSSPPPPPPASSTSSSSPSEVFIDYNKMNTLELVSRHANYALRHLVQKGHAMYIVNYAQHSVLEMRGLVESSHITCAYGIRGERLRTHIVHVGPLDARDVIEIDPVTRRVAFNFDKKGVRKGVVAVSQVEGYGTWFQRKPMLWQRTRRIGALQSQLGAFGYELCAPEEVGRLRDYEVSLLAPHLHHYGSSGAEAVGLIASSQVAQNDRLYMGAFEAPVLAALDAVTQLAHASARHHKLVQAPAQAVSPGASGATRDSSAHVSEGTEMDALRRSLSSERLLPVSWVTRTPPPYVPLEGDLPFKLQMSKPSVFPAQASGKSVLFPTGGTVGSPFVSGVPLSLFEYNLHQGVDHYVFDDAPSARPLKWWNQKSNMPYNGYLYAMRSGLLDYVVPAERLANPLASPGHATSPHRRTTAATQRLKRWRKRHRKATSAGSTTTEAEDVGKEATTTTKAAAETVAAEAAELWVPADGHATELVGHDDAARREEAELVEPLEHQEAGVQYRAAVYHLIPPGPRAARRAAKYRRQARVNTDEQAAHTSPSPHSNQEGTARDDPNRALRRKLRRRRTAAETAKNTDDSPHRGDAV